MKIVPFSFFFLVVFSWSLVGNTLKLRSATGTVSTSVVTSVIWILLICCTWLVMAILTVCSATTVCMPGSALNAGISLTLTLRGSNIRATSGTRPTRASSVACAGDRLLEISFSTIPGRTRFSVPTNAPGATKATHNVPRLIHDWLKRDSSFLTPWFSFYSWTMLDFRRRDMMSQKSNERSQETFKVARTNTSYLVVCVQCFAEKMVLRRGKLLILLN